MVIKEVIDNMDSDRDNIEWQKRVHVADHD